MRSRHPHLLVLWSLASFALPLHPLRGQRVAPPAPDSVTRSRADRFDSQAEQIELYSGARLPEAAMLRMRAAGLRRADDVSGALSLYKAGLDRYYSGRRRAGRDLLVLAADRALSVGDVVQATQALTDAVYVSVELKELRRARTLLRRAQLLTHSPLLTEEKRRDLSRRLWPPSTPAVASSETPGRAASGDSARSP